MNGSASDTQATRIQETGARKSFARCWIGYYVYISIMSAVILEITSEPNHSRPFGYACEVAGSALVYFLIPGILVAVYMLAKALIQRSFTTFISSTGLLWFFVITSTLLGLLVVAGQLTDESVGTVAGAGSPKRDSADTKPGSGLTFLDELEPDTKQSVAKGQSEAAIPASVRQALENAARQMNSQVPMRIDKYTVLNSASFMGRTAIYRNSVEVDLSDQEFAKLLQDIRPPTIANFRRNPSDAKTFAKYGIVVIYQYTEKGGKVLNLELDFGKDPDLHWARLLAAS